MVGVRAPAGIAQAELEDRVRALPQVERNAQVGGAIRRRRSRRRERRRAPTGSPHGREVGDTGYEDLHEARRALGDALERLELAHHPLPQLRPTPGTALGELALAQILVGLAPGRDVLEDQGEAAVRQHRGGEHVEPAAHRLAAVLEPHGLPAEGDPRIGLDPLALEAGDHLQGRPPRGVDQPGHLLEERVHLEEAVVDRATGVVEDHLRQAVPLVDRREERAEARLALAQGVLRRAPAMGVDDRADVSEELAGGPGAGAPGVDRPPVLAVGSAQPVVEREGLPPGGGLGEHVLRPLAVVRMDRRGPAGAEAAVLVLPGEVVPPAAEVGAAVVGVGGPEHRRGGVGQLLEALGARPLPRGALAFADLGRHGEGAHDHQAQRELEVDQARRGIEVDHAEIPVTAGRRLGREERDHRSGEGDHPGADPEADGEHQADGDVAERDHLEPEDADRRRHASRRQRRRLDQAAPVETADSGTQREDRRRHDQHPEAVPHPPFAGEAGPPVAVVEPRERGGADDPPDQRRDHHAADAEGDQVDRARGGPPAGAPR